KRPCGGDGADQLGIRARVHRPADQRHLDLGVGEEAVGRRGHEAAAPGRSVFGPICQRAVALATTSPAVSLIAAVTSTSRRSVTYSKTGALASLVNVPRAFLTYSIERPVRIERVSAGRPVMVARPVETSARFISAIACTERRWLRTAGRSR